MYLLIYVASKSTAKYVRVVLLNLKSLFVVYFKRERDKKRLRKFEENETKTITKYSPCGILKLKFYFVCRFCKLSISK